MNRRSLFSRFITFSALALTTFNARSDIDPALLVRSNLAVRALLEGTGLTRTTSATATFKKSRQEGASELVEVHLSQERIGTIRLLLKGPKGFMERRDARYRGLFMASGFFAGQSAVHLMGARNDTVMVGFQYPYGIEDMARNPAAIYQFVKNTPLQIAATLQWLRDQKWLRKRGIVAMGVSLGGLFIPSSLRIAQSLGVEVKGTILAFTGADIVPVLEKQLSGSLPFGSLQVALRLIENLVTLHDPKLHLPFLEGHFLTVRADQDQLFPRATSQILEDLLPHPKTFEVVHGPHIDVDQHEVIAQTKRVVNEWIDAELAH